MMLKSLVFSVVKKTSCLIGILMLVGCSKPDPLRHVSDDLEKGLGKQLFYTNEDYCDSSVYSFSDEWYERVVPLILKEEWWEQPPVQLKKPGGSAMTEQEQGFEATDCNGGFKQYDVFFEEAIKNKDKNNYYSATDRQFMLIVKKEKLLFIAEFY